MSEQQIDAAQDNFDREDARHFRKQVIALRQAVACALEEEASARGAYGQKVALRKEAEEKLESYLTNYARPIPLFDCQSNRGSNGQIEEVPEVAQPAAEPEEHEVKEKPAQPDLFAGPNPNTASVERAGAEELPAEPAPVPSGKPKKTRSRKGDR